jgi:hypothetical protein
MWPLRSKKKSSTTSPTTPSWTINQRSHDIIKAYFKKHCDAFSSQRLANEKMHIKFEKAGIHTQCELLDAEQAAMIKIIWTCANDLNNLPNEVKQQFVNYPKTISEPITSFQDQLKVAVDYINENKNTRTIVFTTLESLFESILSSMYTVLTWLHSELRSTN